MAPAPGPRGRTACICLSADKRAPAQAKGPPRQDKGEKTRKIRSGARNPEVQPRRAEQAKPLAEVTPGGKTRKSNLTSRLTSRPTSRPDKQNGDATLAGGIAVLLGAAYQSGCDPPRLSEASWAASGCADACADG